MQELYIFSYCHKNCIPLRSITRLSEAEAYKKAKELSEKNQDTAFARFDDFKNYYPKRIHTENWLYNQFVQLGGLPETKHPLYFVLHGNDYLKNWFSNGEFTRLSVNNIDDKHISFTFGDSMAKIDKPERKDLLLKEDLYRYINDYNGDIERFLDSIKEKYTYIEAQVWSDIYLNETITS